ncbi:NAD-dependent epimerase/dehydratase family protein [Lactobacillus delbrueckii]|uniref:NAD-dependent epimerase/dehydratase family protein n=1 Tax=Lactobacillus delbrueckii TaxID=1584 RepID=UPI001C705AAC|nr:NAD-dependent epimerase/dehydratase family protein [Lactobacillus delbrueckii]MBW9308239.1 NAD-dependent epimerase/dehydratase family protein [Lactobacillus delbrueckii]
MRVVKNYLYNVGYQVLAIIVPLITSYYVSRVLSPEGVGANMVAGATGMIGSALIDWLLLLNQEKQLNCKVIALGRNKQKARARFASYWEQAGFTFVEGDINQGINCEQDVDYVLQAASNTHPLAYSKFPISTITTNVIGTNNLLDYAAKHKAKRVIFLSSVEVYGENRGDTDKFKEDYLGYLDCNTLRAGYPESKWTGEALCQAYLKEKGLDCVILRLSRAFGPTLLATDSKALSQFLKKGIAKEDIVLKSTGTQQYSYIYSLDAAATVLFALKHGESGQAYNVAGAKCDTALRGLAETIAKLAGSQVVFELPDQEEAAGYSTATKALLDTEKFQQLGFKADTDLEQALAATMWILAARS